MFHESAPPMPALVAHCQQQLRQSAPFTHSDKGVLHLILPHESFDQDSHEQALQSLQDTGVIAYYRYIDSKPQPAILAVLA